MLIASISDIHTDFPENRDAVVRLASEIHAAQADVVVVAGDISHKNDRIDRALRALAEVAPRIVYLPGNHDLWFDVPFAPARHDLDTWHRYRVELRQLAEAAGAHYLPAGPLVLGSVAIAGTCGWYDYSLAPPWIRETVSAETLAEKQLSGILWSDARFIAFRHADGELMRDGEVARVMEKELALQLEALEARDEIEEVVVATHHLAFYEVVKRSGTLPWEFFNAFMGSTGLGEVIQRASKVRTVIYGHTHVIGEQDVGGRRVYGTPLGYPRERKGVGDAELVKTRIGWIRR